MKIFQRLKMKTGNFPGLGTSRGFFSKPWKNPRENFQALENRKE
jgi:hypothetical protein